MASEFIWRDPEAAKQAIAQMQVAAAAAENQSRERIAREQTTAQRYATQAQIADRDKDRAVAREDIASRAGYGTNRTADAIARERANIQYQTIADSITEFDPPTKKELEAAMAASQSLTDDLRNDLRSRRDRAYKVAKANAAIGEQAAKNYTAELSAKGLTGKGLLEDEKAKVYERMAKDRNITFDRVSGRVESMFRPPREDAAGATNGARTIDDVKAELGKQRNGVRSLVGALPPAQSTITAIPSPGFTPRTTDFSVPRPAPALRMADMATPPPMESGWFTVPPELLPPSASAAAPAENRLLQILEKMPQFAMLPPAGKQMVLDQVTGGLMSLPEPTPPRVSDFQTIRPEFIPQDPGFYVAPQ